MQKYLNALVLTIGVSLLAAFTSGAQTIAYDGFNYTAGDGWVKTGVGLNGGTGWGGTWSATAAAVVTNSASSLSYGSLATSGGGVVLGHSAGYPTSGGQTATAQRILSGTLGNIAAAGSGTIWISFMYQNWSDSTGGLAGFREAKLALFSGASTNASGVTAVGGTERLDIGTPNTYAAGASDNLSLYAGSTFASSGIATPRGLSSTPVFLLIELVLDNTTANDTAYLWVNPNSSMFGDNGNAPSTGTAMATFTTADLSSVNALRFAAGNLNGSGTNAVWAADELHLGYTFADVTPVPEPMTIAFGTLGGLLLLAVRRRK